MSRSYIQPGDVLNALVAPANLTAGTGVLIGAQFCIPQETVLSTATFDGYITGVHSHAKVGSQAWTVGQAVYWDDTNKWFSSTATVGFYGQGGIFIAVEAVGSGAGETTGKVRLSGNPAFALSATYVNR
jgi:predicted RecA/RadA family phage recombinase